MRSPTWPCRPGSNSPVPTSRSPTSQAPGPSCGKSTNCSLVGQAQALRTQLSKERGSAAPGASALTDAELRLLPLLSTHLSFPEIGHELFLSPNTIKTQAGSIYRKLGASSRSQAVTCARELGLLEG